NKPGWETETPGTADFVIPSRTYGSLSEYMQYLNMERRGTFKSYVTTKDLTSDGSATIMFAYDTSRDGLKSLMSQSMFNSQSSENLWANQFGSKMKFPQSPPGEHLAIPVGL